MNEPHDPIRTSAGNSEHTDLTQSALEAVTGHLSALQTECAQIRSWLESARHQLAQQEAQIDRHLCQAAALMEQFRNSALAVNLAAAVDLAARVPVSDLDQKENSPLTLRIHTFAQFQVCYNDQVLILGSGKKSGAILRYLLTRSERCAAKETLLELFWPGEPADKANHKLHIAISALRQVLNKALEIDQALGFEDERYFLNPAIHVWLDADEFVGCFHMGQQLEQQGHMVEAVAQYEVGRSLCRGDFLAEDLYADWAAAPRARLEEMVLTLLGRLAACYFDQRRFEESIACCRQIVSKDSFREDAYRQLMQCYCRMGQRNQALREFHLCAQTLQRELGVSPMRETVALYEQIAREE
ncbi:MAG: winged helix-turn-helix domain-containing protein [Anaerolineae bacterium]|nr:winged helix-turn-helix domain-containing protein [Anaerolineae bacterium]